MLCYGNSNLRSLDQGTWIILLRLLVCMYIYIRCKDVFKIVTILILHYAQNISFIDVISLPYLYVTTFGSIHEAWKNILVTNGLDLKRICSDKLMND